jgi:hypothetical protein
MMDFKVNRNALNHSILKEDKLKEWSNLKERKISPDNSLKLHWISKIRYLKC